MEIKIGSVVRVRAGRGKGSCFVALENRDGFVNIADGKTRKLENPKKKNIKHISPMHRTIDTKDLTNKKLRKILAELETQSSAAGKDPAAETL